MTLQIKSFDQLVSDQAAAIEASPSAQLTNFSVGSVLRSIVESNAGVLVFMESLTEAVLATTRLSTSYGEDADSFVNDFGFERQGAIAATGIVTFSRATNTSQAIIPAQILDASGNVIQAGTVVSTSSPSNTQFVCVPNTTNSFYNLSLNAYVIPAGISSIPASVLAITPGVSGNVLAGQINTINSVIAGGGVDSVTNGNSFTSGQSIQSDESLKIAFQLYILGLSKATKAALAAATLNSTGVTRYNLVENKDTAGNTDLGFFFDVVDDGSGNPPDSLVSAVAANVEATRGFTIAYDVVKPTVVNLTISMSVKVIPGTSQSDVTTAIQNSILSFTDNLPIGGQGQDTSGNGFYSYSQLFEIIYDSNSSITNVRNLILNSGTTDLSLTNVNVVIANSSNITVNYDI